MKKYLITGFIAIAAVLFAAETLEERFDRFDKNHDGVLSGDELDAAPFLRQLDLNHDGIVTKEEALTALALMKKAAIKALQKNEPGAGKEILTSEVFKRLDKNGDGKLTPDELTNPEWFAKLDLNKDGVVTLEEAIKAVGERLPQRLFAASAASGVTAPDEASLKEQPQFIKATEHGVGRFITDVTLKNLQGKDVKLFTEKTDKAFVIGLFSASCPISNKLGPELARIEKDYADKGARFVWVDVIADEKQDEITKFISQHGLKSAVLHDADNALAKTLLATTTTEVFVLDAARTLVYRGAVNDQYGLGYAKENAKKTYLRDAIDATLHGDVPTLAATTAPGCALDLPKNATLAKSDVTYHNQIARILNANCVECHHNGGIAPFALTGYDEVIKHAGMIRKQVDRGAMPPWFAGKEFSGAHHVFMNDRSLPDADRADLLAWLNSDRAKGDASQAPLPRQFPGEWTIGKPDLILQLPKPFTIKAEGTMPYQTAVVETNLPDDKWVQAYEIMPTAREVVHHVIVRVHNKGDKINSRGEGLEGYWAAYVPGNSRRILPEGFAKKLPAGAKVSFQIHYTPNGKVTDDQLRIGIIFAKQEPQYEVHVAAVANPRINIPAGAENHVETTQQTIPANMMITALLPHMHVRGKAFKYEVMLPGGKTETLLDIPRYDFNWQIAYTYAQPKFLPAGSTVKITAVYDNSTNNPANPDPTKNVRWGQQTFDEMMIGYVEHYTPLKSASKIASK